MFVQSYSSTPLCATDALQSLAPSAVEPKNVVAGSAAAKLQAQRTLSIDPDARLAALLPLALRSAPAQAVYGRAPDAKPNP